MRHMNAKDGSHGSFLVYFFGLAILVIIVLVFHGWGRVGQDPDYDDQAGNEYAISPTVIPPTSRPSPTLRSPTKTPTAISYGNTTDGGSLGISKKGDSAQNVDTGYTCDHCIKGNIAYDTGERIYHIPGCENYDDARINKSRGERWFSSEAEAQAAGWRKAYNCP